MLQQYLQAEVVNSKAAWDVLVFLERRLRDLIKETLDQFGDKRWIAVYECSLKHDRSISEVYYQNDDIIVSFFNEGGITSTHRLLESDRWSTEDLVSILEYMNQNDD